jgi:heptosyltransferase-2
MKEGTQRGGGGDPSRILVILPNWLGDTVMAGPCLRALRRRYPAARIDVLGTAASAELLAGSPWFDRHFAWGGSALSRLRAASRLRDGRHDLCLLLPNSFASALAARLAGARRIVGYRRDGRGPLLTLALPWHGMTQPQVRAFLALAAACGCAELDERLDLPVGEADRRAAAALLASLPRGPLVVLNPGSNWPSKRWPAERFAEVADALAGGDACGVAVICGPGEREAAESVRSFARVPVRVFADPPLPLGTLKALLAGADLLVTNDSGPRHIARALGTPVVSLFGPVAPSHTAAETGGERVVYLDLPCSPCHKRLCPLGHHGCMRRMASGPVIEAARALLRDGRPRAAAAAGEYNRLP